MHRGYPRVSTAARAGSGAISHRTARSGGSGSGADDPVQRLADDEVDHRGKTPVDQHGLDHRVLSGTGAGALRDVEALELPEVDPPREVGEELDDRVVEVEAQRHEQ